MATHYSDQIQNIDAVPRVKLPPRDYRGRTRKLWFDFTVPAGNAAVNDLVELVEVPAGCRINGGYFAAEAMTTGGGNASIQIGDGTAAAKYLGTTNIDAAAEANFANTIALAFGEVVATTFRLTAKAITEAWAAGKLLKGYLEITED